VEQKTNEEESRPALSDPEIEYYYTGFLRVLRRYRLMIMLGWIIVFAGFGSLFLGWTLGLPHGLIDLSLSVLLILAGILVVQQSIAALQEYVSVAFRPGQHDALAEIHSIMEEIRRGGWREATGGIRKVEDIAAKHELQVADRTGSSQFFQEG